MKSQNTLILDKVITREKCANTKITQSFYSLHKINLSHKRKVVGFSAQKENHESIADAQNNSMLNYINARNLTRSELFPK